MLNQSVTRRSALFVLALLSLPLVAGAGEPAADTHAPTYTADGKIVPPTDYRQWVFLSSGVDMSYNKKAMASKVPMFDNTFVPPAAYQSFLKTGTWPDKTQIVLEIRGSAHDKSINHRGHFQSGAPMAIEMHVKDSKRFKGGWAFFGVDADTMQPAEQIPTDRACYSCHKAHGAVDTTFVQFYPELLPVATKLNTLSDGYLQDEAGDASPAN